MIYSEVGKSCAVDCEVNTYAESQRAPLLFGSAWLETRIRSAHLDLLAQPTRAAFAKLADLVRQRTPQQIARLERARGLR